MKFNAKDSGSVDLATPDVKFKRMSIKSWSGKLYLSSGQNKKIILGNINCRCNVIAPTLLKNINAATKRRNFRWIISWCNSGRG
jgi:hypothetical protein